MLPPKLQPKYLKLARFVLENNYVECKGIDRTFLQMVTVGTAIMMGTSFSVTHAIIFMIWLDSETPGSLSMNFASTLPRYSESTRDSDILTTFC